MTTPRHAPTRLTAAFAAILLTTALAACSDATGANPAPSAGASTTTSAPTESTTSADASPSASSEFETLGDERAAHAARIVQSMDLEEKVAQLFFVTPEALTGVGQVIAAGDSTIAAFLERPVGGIIYFEQNLLDPAQTREMLTAMQDIATDATQIPVFLGVDEEGGTVVRVGGRAGFGIANPGDMRSVGNSGDSTQARTKAEDIGTYLADLGFNLDFAPVADIANSTSTTMSRRVFGSTAETVAPMVVAQVEGFADAGVLSAAKHFPGIGGAQGDSHTDAISTDKTFAQMDDEELVPFRDAIGAGVPFVMVGHLTVREATGSDLPASLNEAVMVDLLRQQMGFEGIIITDSLSMGAVTSFYDADEVGLQAILAGADMILMPLDFEASYQRVLAAVQAGELSEERIDESVQRIVEAKLRLAE